MKITVDRDHGAAHICLKDEVSDHTEKIAEKLLIDYNKDSEIIGIEIIDEAVKGPLELKVE